jgi:hypothetical protein
VVGEEGKKYRLGYKSIESTIAAFFDAGVHVVVVLVEKLGHDLAPNRLFFEGHALAVLT